jgi:fatty acid-binding protein DegV
VQALLGSVLKLKPVICVDHADGKYSTVGKGRTIPQAVEMIGDHLQQTYKEKALWVSVLHGRFAEGAELLSKSLSERLNIKKLEILRISPVLGVHTGPGIVGAAVVPMELMEDLAA